jgi:AcrR family transcriptional regulator
LGIELCARPRNAAATRAAILEAASRRFMSESYEQVGMRDVAGDVGVDAALISRYFGSKEDLFLSVLDGCGKESNLMDGPRAEFGRRMADELVYGQPNEGKMGWLLIMLRSASSPKAASILKQSSDNFHAPFTEWVGGENARVRARLLTGVMMGLGVSRDITGGFDFSPEECATMHAWLAETLQTLIDG